MITFYQYNVLKKKWGETWSCFIQIS